MVPSFIMCDPATNLSISSLWIPSLESDARAALGASRSVGTIPLQLAGLSSRARVLEG